MAKDYMFFPMIRNSAMMFTLTTHILHTMEILNRTKGKKKKAYKLEKQIKIDLFQLS